jgi:hypothetical protein
MCFILKLIDIFMHFLSYPVKILANFIAMFQINSICIMGIIMSGIFPILFFLNVIPTNLKLL